MRKRHFTTTLAGLQPLCHACMAVCIACLTILLMAAFVPAGQALAQDASLTLKMSHTAQGKTTQIAGVTATAYQVASLDDNVNHYTLLEKFQALGVEFDEGVSADQMEKLAAQAADIVKKKKIKGTSATSSAQGTASFGTLPYGVYLVVQTGKTGTAATYEDFDPFLISVPQLTEGGINWSVECMPKFTPEPAKPTTPEPPKKSTPQTGDDLDVGFLLACMVIGGLVAAFSLYMRRRVDRAAHGR